ncbi:sugar ABC transporter substrate-binding protein [Metabacillus sp. GX 13764]|uniref:ABC transporter substrate-binding protein n=1 Tax=Metabacillus kandeliae TaxID=2900151 RepID=UPI001E61ECBA|nr:sugar ABC transporter substrate-binding protein [Metabacillus kandeliae]MCD7035520.1 sugar ABC transporter substrate-binding protein [Metabacillus kandeliae]
MKMKKWAGLAITSMLAASMLLSGCTSSSTGAKGGKTELTLGYYSSGSTDATMNEIITEFEKNNPDVKIKTVTAPYGQFFQKLDTQIAGGKQPDLWLSDGVLVSKFSERGAIKDLTKYIDKDLKKEDYYGLEFDKDNDGKYWGVPSGIQVGALFYNKDMFDKAKVPYPSDNWTWDDLKSAAAKLTIDSGGKTADEAGFKKDSIKQYGYSFFNITEGWFPILKAFGGSVLDPSLEKSAVNSPENKKALDWIVDGMKRGVIIDPSDLESFQSPFTPFPSGSAAMVTGIYVRTLAANEAHLNYDVAPLPKGPDGKRFSPIIANSWVISSKTDAKKEEAAWKWIKNWATNDGVQQKWANLGESVPVKKSVAQSDKFLKSGTPPEHKKVFLDAVSYAGTLDTNAVWTEWNQKFTDTVYPAFRGETSTDQALQKADTEIQQVLDNFYNKK